METRGRPGVGGAPEVGCGTRVERRGGNSLGLRGGRRHDPTVVNESINLRHQKIVKHTSFVGWVKGFLSIF